MAKAKKPAKPKKWTKLQQLEAKLISVDTTQYGVMRVVGRLENQVKALEAAICPRVAARLNALEKVATIQDDQLKAYAARINALELATYQKTVNKLPTFEETKLVLAARQVVLAYGNKAHYRLRHTVDELKKLVY